jgi:plastocyanin
MYGVLVATLLAACGGYSGMGPGSTPGDGGGGDGGGGGSGGSGGAPSAVTVTVGNNLFRSDRNGSVNGAVDTVAVGGKVTWRWASTGTVPHNVQSIGTPEFSSGAIETGDGSTYEVTFTAPGSYRYNCAIHGDLMSGVVVVAAP